MLVTVSPRHCAKLRRKGHNQILTTNSIRHLSPSSFRHRQHQNLVEASISAHPKHQMGKKQRARRVQQQQKEKQKHKTNKAAAAATAQHADNEEEGEEGGQGQALLSPELAAALGQEAEGGGGGEAVILPSSTTESSNGSNKRKLDARGNVVEEEVCVVESVLASCGRVGWINLS